MGTTSQIKVRQLFIDTNFDFNAKKITNLATPTNGADAVTKDYVDGILGAADALVYKGVIDCSGNPNYPAADAGHLYKISVGGKIGGSAGVAVSAGDDLICFLDSSVSGNQATVGVNWNQIVNSGGSGNVIGPGSSTDNAVARFDSTGGTTLQNSLMTVDDNGSPNIPTGEAYKINGTAINQDNIPDGSTNKVYTSTEKTKLGTVDSNALNKSSILALFIPREVPTGTKNGSNPTFTLANTPVSGTEHIYVNGVLMDAGAGNDYTISTNTITFLTGAIPVATDKILVTYWK